MLGVLHPFCQPVTSMKGWRRQGRPASNTASRRRSNLSASPALADAQQQSVASVYHGNFPDSGWRPDSLSAVGSERREGRREDSYITADSLGGPDGPSPAEQSSRRHGQHAPARRPRGNTKHRKRLQRIALVSCTTVNEN